MSFLLDLTNYIATQVSLTLDTDIFYGVVIDPPTKYVLVKIVAGGVENESGIINEPIQVVSQEISYVLTETLAYQIHDILARKPGFDSLPTVYYCDVLMRPFLINRGPGGEYIFTASYLIRKR